MKPVSKKVISIPWAGAGVEAGEGAGLRPVVPLAASGASAIEVKDGASAQKPPSLYTYEIPIKLPKKRLIVIDLDKTLIYYTSKKIKGKEHVAINGNDTFMGKYVYIRPDANRFVKALRDHGYDIAIWTGACNRWAHGVIPCVLSEGNYKALKFIYTQDHCINKRNPTEPELWIYEKPIRKASRHKNPSTGVRYGRDNVLFIDDTAVMFRGCKGNAIIIPPYRGESDDTLFQRLFKYFQEAIFPSQSSVRAINRPFIRWPEMCYNVLKPNTSDEDSE